MLTMSAPGVPCIFGRNEPDQKKKIIVMSSFETIHQTKSKYRFEKKKNYRNDDGFELNSQE